MDHQGLHGLSCRRSQGRHPGHAAINDIVKRSLTSAGVPSHLEPTSIMPWKTGRVLVWDVTCPDTYAPSHISVATREAGAVAAQAEQRKRLKYAELEASHHFVPVAIETSGVCGSEALQFLHELGHRLKAETREPRSLQFLFKRISVAIHLAAFCIMCYSLYGHIRTSASCCSWSVAIAMPPALMISCK